MCVCVIVALIFGCLHVRNFVLLSQDNFVILLAELKEALSAEGMLLTAAVSAGKGTIDPAYNIPEMSKSLDLINVMTYDMHGAWDDYTHHQSGLYAHPLDEGDNLYFNVVGKWAHRHCFYLKWPDEGF